MSNKIKIISIQNFQSHKRTDIPLEGFNVIVGQSSSGKTSIFRALRWLFYGEWDETYPNDKSKPTAVAITLDSGTRILRIRDGNSNQAAIISNGETVKYKSFGSIIPGLRSHLNLEEIEVGNSKINLNFSMQDDPVFMINEPRPNKAQWIGRLYGAHILNEMLRDMAKDKKAIDSKRKDKESEIDKLTVEVSGFKNLEEQENTIKEVSSMIDRLDSLSGLNSELMVLDTYRDQLKKDSWADSLDTESIKMDILKLSKLAELRESISDISRMRKDIERYGSVDPEYLASLRNDINEISELKILYNDYKYISFEIDKVKQESIKTKKSITLFKNKIEKNIIKDGICPVCGGDASNCKDKVVDNIKRIAINGI
jgi:exonuclease SbcC